MMNSENFILITDSNIVTPQGVIEGGWILLHNGIIARLGTQETAIPEIYSAMRIHGKGSYVIPGFIDVHVHGGAGLDFMNADQAELQSITKFHAEHGTTGMLATSVTAPRDELTRLVQRVAEFMQDDPMPYAQLLGVHLEGPFISKMWCGAQNPNFIVPPQVEWLTEWVEKFPGIIKIQTLAPEIPGAYAYIRELAQHGIVPACGHTDATFEQIQQASNLGLRHAVHTFNAMRPLHHREPGTVGAALTDDRIVAEIIADGEHVHPEVIRLLLRCKGIHNVILVTDAISATGMSDGEYNLGGLPVIVHNSVARLQDSGSLAGSTLTTLRGFTYMVNEVGVSIAEASCMASLNPARQIGLDDRYGSLEPNKRADVLMLDGQLNLNRVIIGGRVIR